MGASRSFGLAHARIFAPAPKVVNSKKRAIPTINRESVSVLSMEHLNLEMSLRAPAIKPAGAARSVLVLNLASRRTGRLASNTITCSWERRP